MHNGGCPLPFPRKPRQDVTDTDTNFSRFILDKWSSFFIETNYYHDFFPSDSVDKTNNIILMRNMRQLEREAVKQPDIEIQFDVRWGLIDETTDPICSWSVQRMAKTRDGLLVSMV